MAVDARLLKALMRKLDLSRAAVYRRIAEQGSRLGERPDVAALEVASMAGINFQRFATPAQLERLRAARASLPNTTVTTIAETPARTRSSKKANRKRPSSPGKHVWIVHGRDERVRRAMFDFVRSIGLQPLEWSNVVKKTRKGAPYVGQVLERAFNDASAVIVLMTPDDEAQLKRKYWQKGEETFEKRLTGQARPNVLFEAGIAFGTHPTQTILVEFGKCRPFSDVSGRLVVKMNDSATKRKELADRLAAAGCTLDLSTNAWMTSGDFSYAD